MIYYGFAMLLLISVSYQRQLDSVPTGDPPKLKPGSKRIYQFRPGENLRLTCPIENVKGQSKGGFLWKYRDKTQLIDLESFDETIKVKGPKLTIKNATEGEEGEYQCEGINGFGKATFRLYIFITNDTNKKKDVFPPRFKQKRPELERIVKKGQEVQFYCGYKSNPPPTLEWYHNNTRLLEKRDKIFLTIESVHYMDSGSYRCEISNVLGVVKRVWSLRLGREVQTNLIRNEFKYENSKRSFTVNRFQDARLNCKIRLRNSGNDDKKVIIRWAKVDTKEKITLNSSVLTMKKMKYDYINHTSVEDRNGIYKSVLNIRSVDYKSSGYYACLIVYGTLMEAELFHVKIGDEIEDSSTQTILIASVSGGLLFLLVLVLVCVFSRHRKNSNSSTNRSTKSSSSNSSCVYKKCTPQPHNQKIMMNYYGQQCAPIAQTDFGVISHHTISSNDESSHSKDKMVGYGGQCQFIPPASTNNAQFV